MNIEDFQGENDLGKLKKFIDTVYYSYDNAFRESAIEVREGEKVPLNKIIEKEQIIFLIKAWLGFNSNFNLEKAKELIDKISEQVLPIVGLSQDELMAKLGIICNLFNNFKSKKENKILRKVLNGVISFIGSINAAIGNVYLEGLKEVSELIKNAILD